MIEPRVRRLVTKNFLAALFGSSLLSLALPGCSAGSKAPNGTPDDQTEHPTGPADPTPDGGSTLSCDTPNESCACETPGQIVDCGEVARRSGSYVACSIGKRTCNAGIWGACVGDSVAPAPVPTSAHALALGALSACINNPCDPYCNNYVDNSVGLALDGGLAAEGGLTLAATQVAQATSCTGLSVSPAIQSVVVTDISPLTAAPPTTQFQVQLTPAGCFVSSIPAAWSLNNYNVSAISDTGLFQLYAPVAGSVQVTAFAGAWHANANVNVTILVRKTDQAPANTANSFIGPGAVPDTMTVLYPYANTVFARAMTAPVVQWDNGGSAAQAVKLSLRYPAVGPATFDWSTIVAESSPPRITIPQAVWQAFDQTASAGQAIIAIQRLVGGTLRTEVTRTIGFSSAPLRGQIYYTEYQRGGVTPPAPGGTCSFPLSGAKIRSLDPTGSSAPIDPFGTVAPGGCPVCHSVSANGRTFVTSDRGWGTGGGVSRINSDGTFTPLADAPQSPTPGADSRGFAYAAITPDGTYALQGDNLWGNTNSTLATAYAGRVSGGSGQGLQGDYFANTTLTGTPATSEIDTTVNFTWAGSPASGVTAGNFSVRWTGQVQSYTSETYTFDVEADNGVRLWVNGQQLINNWLVQGSVHSTGSIALTAGVKYDIKLEHNHQPGGSDVILRWQSAKTPQEVIPETQLYPPVQPVGQNGLVAVYYDNIDFTGPSIVRLDNTVDFDWGSGSPDPAIGPDTFSARWYGQVKPAYSETYTFETESDDGIRLWINDVLVVDRWVDQGMSKFSGSINLLAGVKYNVKIEYYENTGGAGARLRWSSPSTPYAVIPSANLFQSYVPPVPATGPAPPPAPTAATNGLSVTYYDNIDFTGTTVHRIDTSVNVDWGNGSPDAAIGGDTFTARWTGQVLPTFSENYTFETETDDGVRLWVNGQLLVNKWVDQGPTKYSGTLALTAGVKYDIKMDYYENGGGASARLRWSSPSTPYAIIPTSQLFPTGDSQTAGVTTIAGGDNGTGNPYVIWRLPTVVNGSSVNASPEASNNWGLGNTVMMVPSFSPDGKKLVFVDGDSGDGAGWRKGLSVFDFNQTGKAFSNRRLVYSTWPSGDVMKWPTFESDSRSVIFQSSLPVDFCTTCDGKTGARYGEMAPTNYYGVPGHLSSVDVTTANAAVPLTNLNIGERPADANRAYQPTSLPAAVGGYRWVVFTSTRPYGNTLNDPALSTSCLSSQLWVSAVDDTTSAAADRSHPAFWLPNQNLGAITATNYINERGYWVQDPCKATGTTAANACLTNEDCCGGAPTDGTSPIAACRIDLPATSPATRHCVPITTGTCVDDGQSCSKDQDCCGVPLSHCLNGVCKQAPPVDVYKDASFTRDYNGTCPSGSRVVWRFFDWKAQTPSDTSLVFYAQTADDPSLLGAATQVQVGTAKGASNTNWIGVDVGSQLPLQNSRLYLRITVVLKASTDHLSAPVITDWRQSFSCPPAE